MPCYSYICEKCNHHFEIVCTISNYKEQIDCELCHKKDNVHREYKLDLSNINTSVIKSDNELKTIGDLANRNRDRMTDDHKASLHEKHNSYKEVQSTKELPKGMSRIQKPKTKYRWPT